MLVNKQTLKSRKKAIKRKVYDCFMFFNEIEILNLRLEYLSPYVDFFVLVECRKTVQGRSKPLFYSDNKLMFKNHIHKIKHLIIDDFPIGIAPHTMESIQRNAMISCLEDCNDHDIILVSDLDELPNLSKMPNKLYDGVVYHFLQDQHIYFANVYKEKHIIWEGGTKVVTYKTIHNNLLDEKFVHYGPTFLSEYNVGCTLTKIRLYRNTKFIYNGGYHLTYLGGVKRIMEKLNSFSHPELIESGKYTEEFIDQNLSNGIDVGASGVHELDSLQKIFRLPDSETLNPLKKHLPKEFFYESCKMQNQLSYQFRRTYEIIKISLRSIFRIKYLFARSIIDKWLTKGI